MYTLEFRALFPTKLELNFIAPYFSVTVVDLC